MDQQIILAVDDNGKFLKYIPKELGHTGEGKRHLAITVLLYNSTGQFLLQRRKHQIFDNLWDLTASTHPLHQADSTDETFEEATFRALKNEYDIENISLKRMGEFNYFAKDGDFCENEHCCLLVGEYNGEVKMNPDVGYEYKWVNKKEFLQDIEANPQKYAPWAVEGVKVLKEAGFFN
ncbi:NUDIX domain-containing protein [Candidatus Daviesbacteria bacterium]|nr:NUDIX domain-containing protein [Candidatus Daviesbacteria bacterium]